MQLDTLFFGGRFLQMLGILTTMSSIILFAGPYGRPRHFIVFTILGLLSYLIGHLLVAHVYTEWKKLKKEKELKQQQSS